MTNFHFERCGGPDKATQSKQQQSDAKRTRQSASLLRGRTIISLSDMMRASSSSVSVFGVLPFHFNINNTHTRTHLCDNCTLLASGIQFQANYRQINDMVNSFYIQLLCTKRYVVFGCRYLSYIPRSFSFFYDFRRAPHAIDNLMWLFFDLMIVAKQKKISYINSINSSIDRIPVWVINTLVVFLDWRWNIFIMWKITEFSDFFYASWHNLFQLMFWFVILHLNSLSADAAAAAAKEADCDRR